MVLGVPALGPGIFQGPKAQSTIGYPSSSASPLEDLVTMNLTTNVQGLPLVPAPCSHVLCAKVAVFVISGSFFLGGGLEEWRGSHFVFKVAVDGHPPMKDSAETSFYRRVDFVPWLLFQAGSSFLSPGRRPASGDAPAEGGELHTQPAGGGAGREGGGFSGGGGGETRGVSLGKKNKPAAADRCS